MWCYIFCWKLSLWLGQLRQDYCCETNAKWFTLIVFTDHILFQKWNRIGSKSDEINASDSDPNWAVVVPTWYYLFGISAELCRRCANVTLFVRNFGLCRFVRIFGRIVPNLRLYFMPRCAVVDTICSDFRQNCADFETILCWIVPILRLFFSRIVPSLCRSSDYFCTNKIISNMCWFVLF